MFSNPQRNRIWKGVLIGVVCLWGRVQAGEVKFVDVAAAMGLDFVHENGVSSTKRLPETYGSGCAFLDYDGDGDLDAYLVNGGDLGPARDRFPNRLYRNEGQHFADVTEAAGVPGGGYGMGVAAADYDNDGDVDLYLANWGEDILYRNHGDGRFSEVTRAVGLGNAQWGSSTGFLDYDNDGNLDLFVVNYVDFHLDTQPWCGRRDLDLRFYCDPRHYGSTVDRLFRNQGDGTFADVGPEEGIVHAANGLGVVCGDLDGDADTDIYVTNDMTPNFFYENQGDGRFEEIGLLSGIAFSADGMAQAGMGVDAADYDNDGDLDLFVANYQLENNCLYRNDGAFFSEVAFQSGLGEISLNYLGFGAGFFDYDNDGWLDLFVTNGHVHDNIEAFDPLVTYAQKTQIFHNEDQGRYVERTGELGPALQVDYVGRGSAFGDFDQDGDVDILILNSGRHAVLLRNEGGHANNWLQVDLEGTQSNREGVGARLYAQVGQLRLFREVKAGSGYLSAGPKTAFFGLGSHPQVDRLEIHWPSGIVQVREDIPANQRLHVVEEAGS